MKKSEREFLELLESKAREDSELIRGGLFPRWAAFVGEWFGVNPWRVMIPLSVLIYVFARVVFGDVVREAFLAIYGGYRGA